MQFHEKKFFLEKFWSLFVFPSEDIRLWQVLITLVICSDTSSIASIASSEESDKGFLARSSHLGECLKKDKKMLCIKNTRQYYDAVFRKKFFDFRVVFTYFFITFNFNGFFFRCGSGSFTNSIFVLLDFRWYMTFIFGMVRWMSSMVFRFFFWGKFYLFFVFFHPFCQRHFLESNGKTQLINWSHKKYNQFFWIKWSFLWCSVMNWKV